MANERLRALLLERRVTTFKLAEAVQVDAKTVERWIVADRVPYRKHRYNVAAFFGVDESYVWPDALDNEQITAASESEIVAVYPYRRAVPRDAWGHLFGQAEQEIVILAYSLVLLPSRRRRPTADHRRKGEGRRTRPHPARRSGKPARARTRAVGRDRRHDAGQVRSAITDRKSVV